MRTPKSGKVGGGKNIYGFPIGILMLNTQFPRIPGEMGNAWTWDFPVLYKVVKGASPHRVVRESDPTLLEPFISAANELVKDGVEAVTTNCGFLAMFQRELADAIPVPVFTSTLMMMPLVYRMLKPSQKIGVMSVNGSSLKPKHFEGVGASDIPYVIGGMETTEKGHFYHTLIDDQLELDIDLARAEHREVASKLVAENPDIGAIILECTNMPPFANDVREVTGRPVFDIVTFVNFVYNSIVKPDIRGVM
jgi:hypothetical protein